MASEFEQLRIEATDTLVTLRQRMVGLRGRRVLLIWSPDNKHLSRRLDLVLLQREAHRRAIQLAIVTADADLAKHAADLNISALESVEAGVSERWKRARPKVFLPRYHKPRADLDQDDLDFIASRIAGRGRRSLWRSMLERSLALLLLLAVTGTALYLVVPAASVAVSLRQEQVSVSVNIIADPKSSALKLDQGVIPAQTLRESVETTVTIPSTGIVRLESVSAAGVVLFTNLTDARVVIPRGTILGTSAGEPIIFETAADAAVPAGQGQSIGATVVAMDGYRGAIGNVDAGMINTVLGALSDHVAVINLAPSAGGDAPSVRTVTAEDRAKLLESARIQLQSLAFERMRAALSENQVLVIESIQLEDERKDWISFSADIGAMTSELSLTMQALVSALVVDERYARQIAAARLKDLAPPGTQLRDDSLEYRRGPFTVDNAKGLVRFTFTGAARVVAAIDDDALRAQLAGLPLEEARAYLAAHEALSRSAPATFELRPAGLTRLPHLPIRIELSLRESDQ